MKSDQISEREAGKRNDLALKLQVSDKSSL